MSYSQHDEEKHILRILGFDSIDPQVGRFLDIGAYNPTAFSNTRALYERGWSGVLVEASPGPFLDLLAAYGHDERMEVVCAAVSIHSGMVRFQHSEAGVGTSDDSHYQKWRERVTFDGRFWVNGLPLYTLLCQFGADFDFVNIDVEGGSADLFTHALTDARLKPKCWCVEHDGRQEELTRLALRQGYVLEHLNGENLIFARQAGHDGN